MEELEFRISEKVLASTQVYKEYTPGTGKSIDILIIKAEANYTPNSEIRVVWDFEGNGEEILWSIKGSGEFEYGIAIPANDVDGIKKLALIAENAEPDLLNMSGYMKIRVK